MKVGDGVAVERTSLGEKFWCLQKPPYPAGEVLCSFKNRLCCDTPQDEKLKLSHMVFIKKYFVKHELIFHTLKFHIKQRKPC